MSKRKDGDCYVIAANLLMDEFADTDRAFLVHGTVYHDLTGRHGHAWVEVDQDVPLDHGMKITMAIDRSNGNNVTMPASLYYMLGHVQDEPRKYTPTQARTMLLRTGHYGPWEDATETRAAARIAVEDVRRYIATMRCVLPDVDLCPALCPEPPAIIEDCEGCPYKATGDEPEVEPELGASDPYADIGYSGHRRRR